MTLQLDQEAQKFLRLASQDEVILDKLLDDDDISDASWGFHAQQAVEKLFKSVLTKKKIIFPKTHDLTALSELLLDADIKLTFSTKTLDELELLTPFATIFRYEDGFIESIDRKATRSFVANVRKWAENLIK